MPALQNIRLHRRTLLQGVLAMAGASALPGRGYALSASPQGAQISADFDPLSGMWLGWDAGHENLTLALTQALRQDGRLLRRDVGRVPAASSRKKAFIAQSTKSNVHVSTGPSVVGEEIQKVTNDHGSSPMRFLQM